MSTQLAPGFDPAPATPGWGAPRRATRRGASFFARLVRNPSALIGGVIVLIVVATALLSLAWTPYNPIALSSQMLKGPSAAHWLGTDEYGRDVLSRLMAGTRITLAAGVFSVLIAGLAGITAGLAAAERGGLTSDGIMRLVDLLFAFPALLLAITLAAALGSSTFTAMLAIGVASVPYFARVTRGAALTVLSSEYVLAARSYGRSRLAIVRRHVLPNIAPLILVQTSLLFSVSILAEAGLSYLGLGTPPPSSAWGLMLADAQHEYLQADPLLSVWPVLAIVITILGFNLLADGLGDLLDPRLRSRS
jgi:peptide/nickel transport system permease protein